MAHDPGFATNVPKKEGIMASPSAPLPGMSLNPPPTYPAMNMQGVDLLGGLGEIEPTGPTGSREPPITQLLQPTPKQMVVLPDNGYPITDQTSTIPGNQLSTGGFFMDPQPSFLPQNQPPPQNFDLMFSMEPSQPPAIPPQLPFQPTTNTQEEGNIYIIYIIYIYI